MIARATRNGLLINSSFSAQDVQKNGKICRIFQLVGVLIAPLLFFPPGGKDVLKHFVQWKATPEDNSPHTVHRNCTLTDFVHCNDTLDGKYTFSRSFSKPTGLSCCFPILRVRGGRPAPPRRLVLGELEETPPGLRVEISGNNLKTPVDLMDLQVTQLNLLKHQRLGKGRSEALEPRVEPPV